MPSDSSSSRDHPRMGGEKKSSRCCTSIGLGSPPRRRGKAIWGPSSLWRVRITPAWAGKSAPAGHTAAIEQDHPRAGREKNKELEGVWLPMGSPPRRRGKERSTALVGTPTRITPALAGKSLSRPPAGGRERDHPRVGGEKAENLLPEICLPGSPPRGRGKARHLSHGLLPCG